MSDAKKPLKGGYFICNECATNRKLTTKYPIGGNTVCYVDCEFCGKKARPVRP
jgi:hypothetical protein